MILKCVALCHDMFIMPLQQVISKLQLVYGVKGNNADAISTVS